MTACKTHEGHAHAHGEGCGHPAVRHEDHTDYLHDNHLHHMHAGHVDEHSLCVCGSHPSDCTPEHACNSHDGAHAHGNDCGHPSVPHGDHMDFLVAGHLHSPHNGHCDHHGAI